MSKDNPNGKLFFFNKNLSKEKILNIIKLMGEIGVFSTLSINLILKILKKIIIKIIGGNKKKLK